MNRKTRKAQRERDKLNGWWQSHIVGEWFRESPGSARDTMARLFDRAAEHYVNEDGRTVEDLEHELDRCIRLYGGLAVRADAVREQGATGATGTPGFPVIKRAYLEDVATA